MAEQNPQSTPSVAPGGDPLDQMQSPSAAPLSIGKALVWLVILLLILGGISYVFVPGVGMVPGTEGDTEMAELGANMLSGDYRSAAQISEQILADDDRSVEEKARALALALSAEYRVTGDRAAMIESIRLIKQYIADPSVSLDTRARLISALAAQYQVSGGDKAIFDEMFDGQPFASMKATGMANSDQDARLSIRQLLEWSYATMPTAYAAISISRWYSEQPLFNASLSEAQTKELALKAEDFLKKAEAASEQESRLMQNYEATTAYINYRHWRAVIYGRLATTIGEPYLSQYVKEYEDALAFADQSSTAIAKETSLYTRMFFASRLRLAGNREMTIAQLDELARRMDMIDVKSVNAFFSFLRVEHAERPDGPTYDLLVKRNFRLSPSFEASVERVLAQ